jgi:hypothetical protein
LWKLSRQNLLLFNNGPTNLNSNGIIDAKYIKYAIVIHYTLVPIPHEGIILSHIIMFHEQDETNQTLFLSQPHFGQVWG